MSYITQFFMPNGQWEKKSEYCLQPNYSTPLIRADLKADSEEIKCVIYLPSCYYSENTHVLREAYTLKKSFMKTSTEGIVAQTFVQQATGMNLLKTHRRELGSKLIEFSTTVPHNRLNETQYVFCTTDRDTLSIQLTWHVQETTLTPTPEATENQTSALAGSEGMT
ncbi:hypothetical protein SprV_0802641900 [Sparganum proliferum]